MRGPQRHAGLRHAIGPGLRNSQRNAKVGDQRVAALQQNILRLHIAMHHTERVRVPQRIGSFARDTERLLNRQLSFAIQARPQRFAIDKRHHVEEVAARTAAVEQRQNMRMLQSRREFDFLEEPLGPDHRRQFGVQHLERHLTPVAHVFCQVDRCHAAAAELSEQGVAVGESAGQRGGNVSGHQYSGQKTVPFMSTITPPSAPRSGAPGASIECSFVVMRGPLAVNVHGT